jgi:protocatechuate 3,4-dioxygenase beta subunit
MEVPFYKPNALLRDRTCSGLTVSGRVLSYPECKPNAQAVNEYWRANPEGVYDAARRATIFSNKEGRYKFVTDFPGTYPGRPAHIHFKMGAHGFKFLTSQLYFRKKVSEVIFDIVLVLDK